MTQTIEKPPTKKSWKELRTIRLMVLSATQVETYRSCKRKWWLKTVRKLADPPKPGATVFGTVMHGVIQRYLEGDALGRDASGNPIDLYPPGWEIAYGRYPGKDGKLPVEGRVNPAEADTIKRLVNQAIEGGVLERIPERWVEWKFRLPVLSNVPCPTCQNIVCHKCGGAETRRGGNCTCSTCPICHAPFGMDHHMPSHEHASALALAREDLDAASAALNIRPWVCPDCGNDYKGVRVDLEGYVDYMTRDGIQDHKSVKKRKYIKSKDALRDNPQMLIYAYALLKEYLEGGMPLPEKFSLRHNAYCKDPDDPLVRKVEVFVDPQEVTEHWRKVETDAADMVKMRANLNSWHECPGPADPNACNAYGGCCYLSICSGRESEEMYEKRLDSHQLFQHTLDSQQGQSSDLPLIPQPIPERNPMSMLAARLGQNPAQPVPPTQMAAMQAAQVGTAINPPAPPPVVQAPIQGVPNAVPWARADCTACKGLGFNTNGNACMICKINNQKVGAETIDAYNFSPVGDGTVFWQRKDNDTIQGISPMVHGAIAVQVQAQVQAPVQQPVQQQPVQQPVHVQQQPVQMQAPVQQMPIQQQPVQMQAPVQQMPIQQQPVQQQQQPIQATINPAPAQTPTADAEGDDTDAKTGKKRGRRLVGFTMIINATLAKSVSAPIRLHEKFEQIKAELVKELVATGKAPASATYYDLDPFKRREEIAKVAAIIVKDFGTDDVVVDLYNADPDLKAFASSLRPFAWKEIVGTV